MIVFTFPGYEHAADFADRVPFDATQEHHDVAVYVADGDRADRARRIAEDYFGIEVWGTE